MSRQKKEKEKKIQPFMCRLNRVGIKGSYFADFEKMEDNDAILLTLRVINTLAEHLLPKDEKYIPTFKLHLATFLLHGLEFDADTLLENIKDPKKLLGAFALKPLKQDEE